MNFYQSLNASTTAAIIAAASISIFNYFGRVQSGFSSAIFCITMALFFILFSIKSGLEDHRYFIDGHAPRAEQFFGIIVSVTTRVMFAIAAYSLLEPSISFWVLTISFILLSIWTALHIIRVYYYGISGEADRSIAERKRWLYWNFAYAFPGMLCIISSAPIIFANFMAILMLVLVIYDILTSETYLLAAVNS